MAQKKPAAKRTARSSTGTKVARYMPAMPFDSLVVYVHGVGRHGPSDQLKLEWDLALFGRDMGVRSRMAYWADLVHPPAGKAAPRQSADARTLDLDAVLHEAGFSGARQAEPRAFALNVLDELGLQEEVSEAGPRKKVVPLPTGMRKPMSRSVLQAFVGDTAAYFFKSSLRQRIRERLVDQLKLPRDQPVTVVAHSQGSVIAYEVLSGLPWQLSLDALVTLGSPLGIRELQDFLDPSPRVPATMRRWNNFADPLDWIAANKALAADFGSGVVQDDLVMHMASPRFGGLDPHSAVSYLAHPSVRLAVNDSMRIDLMSRFVMARDVGERLGTRGEERHSVLIEVLEPGYRALGESPDTMAKVEAMERDQLPGQDATPMLKLEHRIARAAAALQQLVADPAKARIDPLRRFVSARLTSDELRAVGGAHEDLRIYAVWQSSPKSKLTDRSMRVLGCDVALTNFGADGRGITWAVLDTGVRGSHPHFDGVITAVWDYTRPGPAVKVRIEASHDPDGHGTHVAGIIAGKPPAGGYDPVQRRERGAAPSAQLIVYKVLDDTGQGEDAWIIKALDHIAEQNENVVGGHAIHGVNLSLGGPFDKTVYGCGFSPICAELRRLWRAGVLVVVACGNEGSQDGISDPANLEESIAVGSVNPDRPSQYGVSPFSSRGPTADGRVKPDVVAPGEGISSCNARYRRPVDWYCRESGTSTAAAHVSGLLAAFLSVRREYRGRPEDVKKLLLTCCTDVGRDPYFQGRGVPNLMQMLLGVAPSADVRRVADDSLPVRGPNTARIFICYRRDDSPGSAGRICDSLRKHFGNEDVFMDVDNIGDGIDFTEYIQKTISECRVFIAIIGRSWLSMLRERKTATDLVQLEIAAGLSRPIRLVPVLIDGAVMPKEDELPLAISMLARRNAREIRNNNGFAGDIEGLIMNVEQALR